MIDLLSKLLNCGTLLLIALLILLALPQSRLREIVLPFVGWAVAALSAAYVILPFDLVPEALLGPFGLIDDLVAVAVAIASAITASQSGRSNKQLH